MSQPLAETIFWIAALSCAVAELAILRSTFSARRIEQSELVPTASRGGELVWAIIPALVLVALLFATWQRLEAREAHMKMMDHSGMQMPMPVTTPSPSPR